MDLKTLSTAELRQLLADRKVSKPKLNGAGLRHAVPIPSSSTAPPYSEESMALHFAATYENALKYIPAWNRWKVWDGSRWSDDQKISGLAKVREICRQTALLYAEIAKGPSGPKGIASNRTANGVLSLSRADHRLVATIDDWDKDDGLLNTPAGTIDLTTLAMRPHDPKDCITRVTAVAPGGECPLWIEFLTKITAGSLAMMLYLRRMFGYALTGDTREQALFFMYGTGANGKSVIIETISGIMGDYHRAAPIETFTASPTDRHPTELAVLHGARLVTSTETEQGRRWAESRIKTLTGGDVVPARFMKQDFFYFRPKFKLVVAGNHKPGLRTVDEAIRRRMNLIPFAVTIPLVERDDKLAVKLRAEWPGILKWLLAGCLEWQQTGLCPPDEVKSATNEYLEAEDALSAWISECCEQSTNGTTGSRELFHSWKGWATTAGEFVGSEKRFSQTLEDRGYVKKSTNRGKIFEGLTVKPSEPEMRWYGDSR